MSKTKTSVPTTRLMIAASETDANLFWATKFLAPDPVIFIEHRKKRYLILNDLEVDRGKKEADVDKVLSYSEVEKKLLGKNGKRPQMSDVIGKVLNDLGAKEITVPATFPLSFAINLQKRKFKTVPKADPFYEERVLKTAQEKAAIKSALRHTSDAIQAAYSMLGESKIKGNRIYHGGEVLTSERLRQTINMHLMSKNCLGKHTIVAGGNQAVDPHCEGYGPLKPGETIVMDVFPRSMDSQYFADMTRTVVKGKANEKIKKMWHTVKEAQEGGIKRIRAGVNGQDVHQWIHEYFEARGYHTGRVDGRMQGFFHGTGHGLGLDIHEAPRVSKVGEILKAGTVVTVEPGLYYQGIGGVRIEDVVYVKKDCCEVLSKCPKILEIA
ncbi:MAG: Xaa-Pro peptidase family protein [Deltaproteobacteria bacterium]|nr:Xaa-Pro peptidase family protein [Deltaproteobacteria bacterium]